MCMESEVQFEFVFIQKINIVPFVLTMLNMMKNVRISNKQNFLYCYFMPKCISPKPNVPFLMSVTYKL